jgi:hypothetical protein
LREPVRDIEIVVPAERWATVRSDDRFIELMRLARAVNSLGIAFPPLQLTLADQSPSARRNRFAAFFYAAAIIKEGLDTAQSLGRWYRELPQYREGLASILRDKDVKQFRTDVLDPIRDKLVFHFDRDALTAGFAAMVLEGDVRIASFPDTGPQLGETHFDAADDAVLGFLFGDRIDEDTFLVRVEKFMKQLVALMNRFIPASHKLIAKGMIDLGCSKKWMDRHPGFDDDAT